ncbi:DUF6946 family protein [Coraliomargarita parva]|uniref:DUF6946 family protein n=1 Tax=Coraliomargarita parva TaxID=3014050 RepID=UPI0022B2C80C|nr:hypothetical protein [Coraliomargarita parva]
MDNKHKEHLELMSHLIKDGQAIVTIEDWEKYAPPAGKASQWKDGRSAKECAQAWTSANMKGRLLPPEIHKTLSTIEGFDQVLTWTAAPEVRQAFDTLGGNTRNCDLEVRGFGRRGKFLLCIEAKADESFGKTLTKQRQSAEHARSENPKSQQLKRLNDLETRFLKGTKFDPDKLYYQLLTASAGALEEAKREEARYCILMIQEFISQQTDANKRQLNHEALNEFLSVLTKAQITVSENTLIGPIALPSHFDDSYPQFYVGLATRRLPGSGPLN